MKVKLFKLLSIGTCLLSYSCLSAHSPDFFAKGYEDVSVLEQSEDTPTSLDELIYSELDLFEAKAKSPKSKGYTESTAPRNNSNYYGKREHKESEARRKTWKPYFDESNSFDAKTSFFYRTDIGLGLLYTSSVSGDISTIPQPSTNVVNTNSSAPYKSKLSYNRTPLYEYIVGYQVLPLLQVGLSYMHQGNVTYQTALLPSAPSALVYSAQNQFTSNVNLDAITLKFYSQLPWPLVWRNSLSNLYLGTGFGLGWQSWTSNFVLAQHSNAGSGRASDLFTLRQKISTNFVWGADAGLRVRSLNNLSHFSFAAGMKFFLWGQARNIGKINQQGTQKIGLFKPFKIKTLYQWSPYLSVEWNFPNGNILKTKYYQKSEMSPMFTQMNVGVGTLSFKDMRGNFIPLPNANGTLNEGWQTALSRKIQYNCTPLFEYLLQHRFNRFVQLGVSFQNQGGVSFQTAPMPTQGSATTFTGDYSQLTGYLNLNALLIKGYALLPLFSPNRTCDLSAYFGLAFGPSWQTWNRLSLNLVGFSSQSQTHLTWALPLKQKICANMMISLDWGLKLTNIHVQDYFSLVAGCKYNHWGQARNIGLQTQQSSSGTGLNQPMNIKRVIQWAPYLGVQWNFPNNYWSKKPYYVEGRSPNTWRPFFIHLSSLEKKNGIFTQMNVGLGLLYFSGIRGNLSPIPAGEYNLVSRQVPIKGRLTYNRTPLFEYNLGYQFCPYLKMMVSYQHQGNVTVQTKLLPNYANTVGTYTNRSSKFSSDLLLDALMMKFSSEIPYSLVFKNVVYSSYIGAGCGAVWQTWKNVELNQQVTSGGFTTNVMTSIRQQVSATFGFLVDVGIRMRSPFPNTGFSAVTGLKFNYWGKSNSIGDIQDQYMPRRGFASPFRVRSVYQWAPYLGVQWNF